MPPRARFGRPFTSGSPRGRSSSSTSRRSRAPRRALAAHVLERAAGRRRRGPRRGRHLRAGRRARRAATARSLLLAGHFDTVPAQGNRPGRRDGGAVHGLGAADMKGAVAVMVELALALARSATRARPGPRPLRPRGAADRRERPDAAAGPRAGPARRRRGRRPGAHGQRDPRRLPGEPQRDLDVHRPQRALGAALAGGQRDPPGGRRDRPARGVRAPARDLRRAGVHRGGLRDGDPRRHRPQRRARRGRRYA